MLRPYVVAIVKTSLKPIMSGKRDPISLVCINIHRPCNSAMKSRVFSRNGSAKTCLMLRLASFRCSAVTMRATRRGARGGRRRKSGSRRRGSQVQGHTRRGRGQRIAHRWRCAIRSLKICELGGAVRCAGTSCGNEFSVQHTRHDAALVYRTSRSAVLSRGPRHLELT